MNYNGYDELMTYFKFEFNVYIMLLIIILVGLIKSVNKYFKLKKSDDNGSNILISLLAVLGLVNAMFFNGVISDIPIKSGHLWVEKTSHLFIIAIILFTVQITFVVLTEIRIGKLKK